MDHFLKKTFIFSQLKSVQEYILKPHFCKKAVEGLKLVENSPVQLNERCVGGWVQSKQRTTKLSVTKFRKTILPSYTHNSQLRNDIV